MMFAAGDTFLNELSSAAPQHLWVVISDPVQDDGQLVIVNFTSWLPGRDESCVLLKGDHPFIRHKTVVSYYDAKIVPREWLVKMERAGLVVIQSPVSHKMLQKIRDGAAQSEDTPMVVVGFLQGQGLI
jgi:hypothetical protein